MPQWMDFIPRPIPNPGRGQITPLPNQIAPPQINPIPTMPDMNFGFRNQMAPQEQPAMDAFQNYLGQQPNRADYAPSKMRRIGAAIAGIGTGWRDPAAGYNLSSGIVEQPYQNAMQDWGLRGKGLESAAQIEQRNQANENTQWRNLANAMNTQQRNQITQGRNNVLEEQGGRRLSVQEQDAKTRETNAKNNGDYIQARIKALGQGNYKVLNGNPGEPDHLVDTKTGKIIPLIDEQGNAIDISGPPEIAQKQIDGAMDRAKLAAKTSSDNSVRSAETSAANTKLRTDTQKAIEELRQENKVNTASVGQNNQSAQQALKDVAAKNSGWIGKWIQQSKAGVLSVVFPDTENSTPEELADFKTFYDEYKRYKGRTVAPKGVVLPPLNKITAPSTTIGKVTAPMIKVKTKEGQMGQIPAGALKQFLADNPGSAEVK